MRSLRAATLITALVATVLGACSPVAPEPSASPQTATATPSATDPQPTASGTGATDAPGGETSLMCVGFGTRPGRTIELPLQTCPPSNAGDEADQGRRGRDWEGNDDIEATDSAGPGDCDWQTARLLHVEEEGRDDYRQYVRDPDGVLPDDNQLSEFDADTELPLDATFPELRSGGLELWFVPDDHAVYIVGPDVTERWPRVDPPLTCG